MWPVKVIVDFSLLDIIYISNAIPFPSFPRPKVLISPQTPVSKSVRPHLPTPTSLS